MKLIIEITLDNEAYRHGEGELTENLENIIKKLNWGDDTGIVFDSNGNKTGEWSITE